MTTQTHRLLRRRPTDSFPIRLAIIRAEMRWNYDQAAAATGINKESWRQWEKGISRCSDVAGVAHKIAAVTTYDAGWIVFGGPLQEPNLPDGGQAGGLADGCAARDSNPEPAD